MTSPPAGFEQLVIRSGFAAEFGPIFARREGNRVWLGFRVDTGHCDADGACHAGALATFADVQLGALQRMQALPPGRHPTVSLSLDHVGLARLGDWVEGEIAWAPAARGLVFTEIAARAAGATIARATALYAAAGGNAPPPSIAAAPSPSSPPPPLDYRELDLGPGFARRFGPVYARVREDRATLGFRVAAGHGNIWGACHGGAVASFSLLQFEALRLAGAAPDGRSPIIRHSVDFLAAARLHEWVECEATLVEATRRFLFTRAVLTVGGARIARSQAIFAAPGVNGS